MILFSVICFVLFAFKMVFGRNWWASTMAFTIGASYQNLEAIIMRKISNKRGYINNYWVSDFV